MSRLHDPGPGELLDRLTILALKLVQAPADRDVTHWAAESEALLLVDIRVPLRWVLALAAVNAALWQAEDEIRRLRASPIQDTPVVEAAVTCAYRIVQLNDRRAALVHQLNQQAGLTRAPEKLT